MFFLVFTLLFRILFLKCLLSRFIIRLLLQLLLMMHADHALIFIPEQAIDIDPGEVMVLFTFSICVFFIKKFFTLHFHD